MIVLSCFALCGLDIDVNVPRDRAVMFSSVCSIYGIYVNVHHDRASYFRLCVLDTDFNVPHDRSIMFSSVCSRYGR